MDIIITYFLKIGSKNKIKLHSPPKKCKPT